MCYAERVECRKKNLKRKLWRHEYSNPADIMRRALAELQDRVMKGEKIPWVRFSTNGSLPMTWRARQNKRFNRAMQEIIDFCRIHSIPVHIPVETWEKARFYRQFGAVVRQSCQNDRQFLETTGAVSYVAGVQSQNRMERVNAARELAAKRAAATGRKTVLCPAVASRYLNNNVPNPKAKCGNCIACSLPNVDIVYPLH
jgi:hypothetical protein